jgi:hypothetical protein
VRGAEVLLFAASFGPWCFFVRSLLKSVSNTCAPNLVFFSSSTVQPTAISFSADILLSQLKAFSLFDLQSCSAEYVRGRLLSSGLK